MAKLADSIVVLHSWQKKTQNTARPDIRTIVERYKAALFDVLRKYIEDYNLTQEEAAERMGVQRSRVDDISRGKISGFTIDYLVAMAARVGLDPIKIAA